MCKTENDSTVITMPNADKDNYIYSILQILKSQFDTFDEAVNQEEWAQANGSLVRLLEIFITGDE